MSEFLARREAGFTLLEVIIAMVLIAILSAVTVLSMAFYIPNLRLKSVAQEINLQLRKARLEAIQQGRNCHVEFHKTVGGETFSPIIWVDKNNDDAMDVGEVIFKIQVDPGVWEFISYKGIRFDVGQGINGVSGFTDDLNVPDTSFMLNRRGLSDDDGVIYLLNARGSTKTIMVTLGGAVKVM